jgi:hypothetical protein
MRGNWGIGNVGMCCSSLQALGECICNATREHTQQQKVIDKARRESQNLFIHRGDFQNSPKHHLNILHIRHCFLALMLLTFPGFVTVHDGAC